MNNQAKTDLHSPLKLLLNYQNKAKKSKQTNKKNKTKQQQQQQQYEPTTRNISVKLIKKKKFGRLFLLHWFLQSINRVT